MNKVAQYFKAITLLDWLLFEKFSYSGDSGSKFLKLGVLLLDLLLVVLQTLVRLRVSHFQLLDLSCQVPPLIYELIIRVSDAPRIHFPQ